jgi:ketosteroid isomerase-like protein
MEPITIWERKDTMTQVQTEHEIAQLADAWSAAERQADIPFLEKTLTADFVGIGPLGFLLTKREWLARHQTGELKYSAHTLDDTNARVYDGAAIVIGRLAQEATYQGNPVNAQLRTTLIFVHQDGQWCLAGLQFSTIGQPPSFARS